MAQQMETRKVRQATPERWQRALQRALFASVEAKQLAGSGEWIVSSASRPGIAYRTDGVTCDCEAAMLGGDPVCLHRAAYWYARACWSWTRSRSPRLRPLVICFRCRARSPAARSALAPPFPLAARAAALVAAADRIAAWSRLGAGELTSPQPHS